jgi:hypothetical protein
MPDEPTTVVIQRYLDALPRDAAAEPVVRELLGRAVGRLRLLCATFLYKSYPRLARPPVSLEADELLGGVVAGLLGALRATRPQTVRQFFALAVARYVTGTSPFYRAMSLFRQGHEQAARKLAIGAAAKMKPLPRDENNPLAGDPDHDDLILWLAYKEQRPRSSSSRYRRRKRRTTRNETGPGLAPRAGGTHRCARAAAHPLTAALVQLSGASTHIPETITSLRGGRCLVRNCGFH